MSTFFGAEDLNDFLAWTLESWQIETCRVQPFVPVVVNQIWPIAIELYDRGYFVIDTVETDVKVFRPWQMVMCQTETAKYISLSTSKKCIKPVRVYNKQNEKK